jgi:hypothetical protein
VIDWPGWDWVIAAGLVLGVPGAAVTLGVLQRRRERRDRLVARRERSRRALPGSIARLERQTGIGEVQDPRA